MPFDQCKYNEADTAMDKNCYVSQQSYGTFDGHLQRLTTVSSPGMQLPSFIFSLQD
jgi:hypothetical protein